MKRRIIEIDDDDVNRVIKPDGYVTHECERNIKEAFKRSTVIGAEYKLPPYTKGLYDAIDKINERKDSELQLERLSHDNDKHTYARILLDDIVEQIEQIISSKCEKENKKALAKWEREHKDDNE